MAPQKTANLQFSGDAQFATLVRCLLSILNYDLVTATFFVKLSASSLKKVYLAINFSMTVLFSPSQQEESCWEKNAILFERKVK